MEKKIKETKKFKYRALDRRPKINGHTYEMKIKK
jgi:hypothetical protein